MRFKVFLLTFFCSSAFLTPVLAHPGRTDAYGCHTCRTNCAKWGLSTGEYHCHNAKALPQPKEPVKSHYNENGGVTTPAPEYKQSKAVGEPPAAKVVPPKVDSAPSKESVKVENKEVQKAEVSKQAEVKKKSFWGLLWEALTK